MAANVEPSGAMSVEELRHLETGVLKTLCLTINTAGSELKYKILDSLSEDDFYFPVTKAVYETLHEMHRRGDYVVSVNLEEELRSTTELPTEFVVDHLFDGPLPSLTELSAWLLRLKERSRSGMIPSVKPPTSEREGGSPGTARSPASRPDATVVRSLASVKQKITEERRRSQPRVHVGPSMTKSTPHASRASQTSERSSPALSRSTPSGLSADVGSVSSSGRAPASNPSASRPALGPRQEVEPGQAPSPSKPTIEPVIRTSSKPKPAEKVAEPYGAVKPELSSEGDDWNDYLEGLARKQGKRLETGFAKLDEALGGLSPGLWILVDEDRDRLVNFLKQLTDQIASRNAAGCLFVASELSKAALRLRTLARLAGVPAADIERGRLRKDSKEWLRIEAEGRKAASWLRRVFVQETRETVEIPFLRALVGKMLEGNDDGGGLVVVDSLDAIEEPEGSSASRLGGLKTLAEDRQVVVAAAAFDTRFLSSKEADYAAVFRSAKDGLELDVLGASNGSTMTIPFVYSREIGRFAES